MILAVHMSLGSSPEKREQNAAALRKVQEAVHRIHMDGKFVGSNPPSLVRTFSGYVQQAMEKWEESLRPFVVSETLKRVRDAAVAGRTTQDAWATGMRMQAEDTLAINIQLREAGRGVNDVKLLIARHQPEALSMWWSDREPDWENFSL